MARIDQTTNSLSVDTDVLFVNVTNNRVGINQNNPNTPLHVVGAATIDGNITSTSGTIQGVTLVIQSGGGGSLTFADGTSMSTAPTSSGLAGTIAAGQVAYGGSADTIAGNNNLYWDNANNRLGIGTTSPSAAIEVDAGAPTEYAILSTGANGRVGLTTQYGGIHFNNVEATTDLWQLSERDTAQFDMAFGTPDAGNNVPASNTQFRVTSGGNVGIGLGSTDPSQKLHVVGTIRQTNVTDAIVYADANGDLGALTVGSGLSLVGSTLTATGGGGGGSPAGSNTEIQFNNSGAFGASPGLTFNGSTLGVQGNIQSGLGYTGKDVTTTISGGGYALVTTANHVWPGSQVGSSPTIMPAIDLATASYDFATLGGAGDCSETHYLIIVAGDRTGNSIVMPDPAAIGLPPGARWTICFNDTSGDPQLVDFLTVPLNGTYSQIESRGALGAVTIFTDGAEWFVESMVDTRGGGIVFN